MVGPTNPFNSAISFDNIGLAWVTIFLVISLEGWTDVMYFVQDAHSFWTWIYFVFLIVIGSFFMINLCLVVIATQFSETKRRETAKASVKYNKPVVIDFLPESLYLTAAQMRAELACSSSSLSSVVSSTGENSANLYRDLLRAASHALRKLRRRAGEWRDMLAVWYIAHRSKKRDLLLSMSTLMFMAGRPS